MVKKLQRMAEKQAASSSGLLDSQLAGAVKASAQQIWLAGMGAFAKAQEEGSKMFEALVKEGVGLQRKTQTAAEDRIGEVTGKMSAMAGEVTNRAGASWDKLEAIFEARTAKAMSRLGVPTDKDLLALTQRVDALALEVARLSKKPARRAAESAEPAAPENAAESAPQRRAAKPANGSLSAKPMPKRAARRRAVVKPADQTS